MKKLILVVSVLCITFWLNATIFRVNNDPLAMAPYLDFQSAHDAATPGDTVLVEGSETDYGSIDINISLTVIGAGGFNTNYESTINDYDNQYHGYLTVFLGEISVNAPNTTLIGIKVGGSYGMYGSYCYPLSVNSTNVSIKRCLCNKIVLAANSSTHVSQSWIGDGDDDDAIYTSGENAALQIDNSYIGKYIQPYIGSVSIINCVLNDMEDINYTQFINCIGLKDDYHNISDILNSTGYTFQNTFFAGSAFGGMDDPELNNQFDVYMPSVFFNASPPIADQQYILNPSGSAIGAGMNGEDIGMFGGNAPYSLGMPVRENPSISSIQVIQSGAGGNILDITIETETHE